MINSKAELRYYFKEDRKVNGYSYNIIKEFFRRLLFPTSTIRFLYILRKAEFYSNNKSVFRFIWFYKLRSISRKLCFSIPINTCGPGLSIAHFGGVIINGNAKLGKNCRIHQFVNIGSSHGGKKAPVLGDNVYVGPGAIVFGDIYIAPNTTIGANAIVNHSFFEENTVIAGTPATVVKRNVENWLTFNGIDNGCL